MTNITRFDPIGEMASFTDGILTLRIPKAEEVKPRQIRINAGTADASETSRNGSAAS